MHFVATANAIVSAAEAARKTAGLTQARMAIAVGMTQGHYSKLVAGKVPAGRKALDALSAWLEREGAPAANPQSRQLEMKRLADEIAMQCMKLARLAAGE